MACDATARLYDVDEDSVVFKRLDKTRKYDQGTVTFRARKGKLINLDKLHESIWASRMSGRTRSGLVSLEVTAIGRVVSSNGKTYLKIAGTEDEFELGSQTSAKEESALKNLRALPAGRNVTVTGLIDNYRGRWPDVLAKKQPTTRRILITSFKEFNRQ